MHEILSHSEDGVLTLTFNRVEKKNAITLAMYATLADALAAAASDAGVRVVALQGDATVFTSGNDIADFQAASVAAGFASADGPAMRFLRGIATFPKPLVAAVCGPAVGIGATLLLHCDLVWAGDNAAFAFPFVNLGLVPEAASTLLLPQMLGYRRAAEALMLGEPFAAETALEAGLINRIVTPEECNAAVQQLARRLAARPLSSLVETKRLMKGGNEAAVLQRMGEEFGSFARMLRGSAAREAFTAFMQKRKPDFSGC